MRHQDHLFEISQRNFTVHDLSHFGDLVFRFSKPIVLSFWMYSTSHKPNYLLLFFFLFIFLRLSKNAFGYPWISLLDRTDIFYVQILNVLHFIIYETCVRTWEQILLSNPTNKPACCNHLKTFFNINQLNWFHISYQRF